MKQIFTLAFLLFPGFILQAQNPAPKKYSSKITSNGKKKTINFNGQWRGEFDENSDFPGLGGNNIVYVLELTTEGTRISGYSYTYFTEGNKKYYTICRLTGSLNRETNEVVVTEIERTKYNTPPNFQNCFQTHRLYYAKEGNEIEELRGTWIPAPNQGAGCGSGTTLLTRRVFSSLPMGTRPPLRNNALANSGIKKPEPKKPPVIVHHNAPPVVAQKTPEEKPRFEKKQTTINDTPIEESPMAMPEIKSSNLLSGLSPKYENRRRDVVKTITITQPVFRLDFYDNGEIDGDSITVFYNGKVVLSHKMLSDKPITLTLALDKNVKENVVTMYADNLGTIPPNTALMIVTDGNKRYEVRMESDYGKSGSVIFKSEGQ